MTQKPASVYPDLRQDLTPTSSGSTICSYSHEGGENGPVAILIHGYPQSAYMYGSSHLSAVKPLKDILGGDTYAKQQQY